MAFFKAIPHVIGFVQAILLGSTLPVIAETAAFDPKIIAADVLEFSKNPFKSIVLECPASNSGIMQHLKKNSDGIVIKSRYKFSGSIVGKLIVEAARRGEGFETIYALDMDKPDSRTRSGLVRRDVSDANQIYNHICLDPNALERFKVRADGNRRELAAKEFSKTSTPKRQGADASTNKTLMTVGLKCANAHDEVLELTRINVDGAKGRLRFKISDNKIVSYIIEGADVGEWFDEIERRSIRISYGENDRLEMLKTISDFQPFHDEVCANPQHLARFNALMQSNRKKVPRSVQKSLLLE